MSQLAVIKPFEYADPDTGDKIAISVSDNYSMLRINSRTYYFDREGGDFDGASTEHHVRGPILVKSDN